MASKPTTYKQRVLALLKPRRWTSSFDIQGVGGLDGLRRVRELRADGYEIKRRPDATDPGQYEYRLVSSPK
jgi:hypothetical protein